MSVRQSRGRPPLGSSRAGIPVGTLQGGSICRGRNGEVMRSAGTDSTWRCRAVDFRMHPVLAKRGKGLASLCVRLIQLGRIICVCQFWVAARAIDFVIGPAGVLRLAAQLSRASARINPRVSRILLN